MPSFNVYLPTDLRDKMNTVWESNPDINWSEIAQRAFWFEIERLNTKPDLMTEKAHP